MFYRLALCSILFVFTLATHAADNPTIYKWIDDKGEIHYSQKLPPGREGEKMRGAPPPADDPEGISSDLQEQVETMDKRLEKKAIEAEDKELSEESLQIRKRNCETARENLAKLQRSGNIRYIGADGQVTRMPEEERQQRLEETNKQIEEFCDE